MSGRFRVGAALAGVVVLTAGGLAAANWATADTRNKTGPQTAHQKQAAKTAVDPLVVETLESELGSDSGVVGSYYDDSGELIVAVSDLSTAALVRRIGAVPRLVKFTAEQLNAVQGELNRLAVSSSAGKVRSWYVDPVSGTVVVSVPRGVHDSITERFLSRALAHGERVTLRQVSGTVRTTADDFSLRGGVQVTKNTGYVCSLGFNARTRKGNRIFLTAGHCTAGKPSFSRNGYVLGNTSTSSFPGHDFGSVGVIEGWDQQGYVEGWGNGNVAVKGIADATVGSTLCKSGKSTGWTCGRIVARNVTVNYGNNRVVRGLFQHTACVESGDSGGASMTGNYAQGITSGAALIDGQCLEKYGQTNESYAQPIAPALQSTKSRLILAN
ncbi:S1 family peptidase [Kribbella sp. VKM Ac-2566]|uniref:S1 family peptidase n=1 Tax=Kribbella sp. VKM Ac-2566 TaxID=2512218 RepID=UPI00106410FD|nr:S1 family peptidase [Kribbella sp. VKM Ac-2566]TDW88528.1 streptogrisin C [Kribbella sp. VKM Ac-2566]